MKILCSSVECCSDRKCEYQFYFFHTEQYIFCLERSYFTSVMSPCFLTVSPLQNVISSRYTNTPSFIGTPCSLPSHPCSRSLVSKTFSPTRSKILRVK